jgi:uncharacterized damage-inducible protein DinB
MTLSLPEPSDGAVDSKQRFLAYLDFYRSVIVHKLDGLSDAELRATRLPSGWSPIELLKHLVFMEQRWLVWRFAGELVEHPFGDDGPDGRWYVGSDEGVADLIEQLYAGGRRTRTIVESADLAQRAMPSPALGGSAPPTLEWVLFHVLQEYARHAGHIDVLRELVDGVTGEE